LRIVVDTNVLISGAFFGGPPLQILMSCVEGRFQLVLSPEILMEYREVGEAFSRKRADSDFDDFLGILVAQALIVDAPSLKRPMSRDPHDDKFIACALAVDAEVIVSGDRDLLSISERLAVPVMRPKDFADRYLRS
jgi:uncharacterized protein